MQQLSRAREAEAAAQRYIRWQQTYEGVHGSSDAFRRCSDLTNRNNGARYSAKNKINLVIAHDFDKLENLIQLYLYRDLHPDWQNPEDFNSFADSLLAEMSNFGRTITEDFMTWAESHRGRLISQPRKFFTKNLLEGQSAITEPSR